MENLAGRESNCTITKELNFSNCPFPGGIGVISGIAIIEDATVPCGELRLYDQYDKLMDTFYL